MARIISLRHCKPEIFPEVHNWLLNMHDRCIASFWTITFSDDDDATAFMLKFGGEDITFSPDKLNRRIREKDSY